MSQTEATAKSAADKPVTLTSKGAATRMRILDAAEGLFASKGYGATRLDDIAAIVGIRTPGLFRHFDNKQALYRAVIDRLMEPFSKIVFGSDPASAPFAALRSVLTYNLETPNLARLLQHAALSQGEELDYVTERWIAPAMARLDDHMGAAQVLDLKSGIHQKTVFMMFNNMIWSLITLAPLGRTVFDVDVERVEVVQEVEALLGEFARALLK